MHDEEGTNEGVGKIWKNDYRACTNRIAPDVKRWGGRLCYVYRPSKSRPGHVLVRFPYMGGHLTVTVREDQVLPLEAANG